MPTIACIVEGQGDERSLPILVRRIAEALDPPVYVTVRVALRAGRNYLMKPTNLEAAVETAARQAGRRGAVLVLIDADDECPATAGPDLLRRARQARSDRPVAVVVAKKEYEAWFLAAAASLRGQRTLPADLAPPPNPEEIRDAKGWLGKRMRDGRKYSETADQPAFTARFDMDTARTSADSFDKCYREIVGLLTTLIPPTQETIADLPAWPAPG